MKRLNRFEVDCLVDVIENKVREIEKEKLEKECGEKVKEWNDELKLILSEKKIWSDKLCKRIEEIDKEVKDKNWNGINVYNDDDYYSDVEDMVFISESKNYYGMMGSLRSKINNEIIINSLKGNDIDSLIDNLVNKFKS